MKENVRFQISAIISVAIIAAVLCVPLSGFWQSEKELADKHSRRLKPAPELSELWTAPRTFFEEGRDWFADRVLWSADAPIVYGKFQYHVLGDAGSDNLARNGDFVFVRNIGNGRDQNSSLSTSCPAEQAWDETASQLISSWQTILDETSQRGVEAYALIIPSKPVLYHDQLPATVGQTLRQRCTANFTGDNPVMQLASAYPDTIAYALDRLVQYKDEPHFFPPQNFHTEGWSAAVAAQTIIEKSSPAEWRAPGIRLAPEEADLERILGFKRTILINKPKFRAGGRRNRALEKQYNKNETLGVTLFNTKPADARHILTISNSFGPTLQPAFGSHYETVTLLNTNGRMGRKKLEKVLDEGVYNVGVDQIIFVMHEVGYYDRLERFASAFTNISENE